MLNKLRTKTGGYGESPPRPSIAKIFSAFVGASVAIGLLAILTDYYAVPLLIAPFGASCVLLFAAPDVPLAQPRNLIGGHLIATTVALLFVHFIPHVTAIETGIAVGLAIALMQMTGTLHPPAGADPLVVIALGASTPWSFLLVPVLLGSIILLVIALIVNNIGAASRWPRYWL